MSLPPHPDAPAPPRPLRVNFFRPIPGFMRREVVFIWLALCGWAVMTFGFQLWLALQTDGGAGSEPATGTIFGFPFHYWFTGQFLIVWFIVICVVFNLLVDRISDRYRRRR